MPGSRRRARRVAPGTLAAFRRAHGQTIVCRTRGCGSLVDLQAARRLARAAGRKRIAKGDGCASALCSAHHAPGRFACAQRRKATALLGGARTLVLAPPTAAARVELWAVPPGRSDEKARRVIATLEAAGGD